jgi:hypothetical protein
VRVPIGTPDASSMTFQPCLRHGPRLINAALPATGSGRLLSGVPPGRSSLLNSRVANTISLKPACPTIRAFPLPNRGCAVFSAVLFRSKSLSQNHLRPTKILVTAYNFCSRFWGFCVYSCASLDTANLKKGQSRAAKDTTECRPMHGRYDLRLANGPTRKQRVREQRARTRTPRGAAWLG